MCLGLPHQHLHLSCTFFCQKNASVNISIIILYDENEETSEVLRSWNHTNLPLNGIGFHNGLEIIARTSSTRFTWADLQKKPRDFETRTTELFAVEINIPEAVEVTNSQGFLSTKPYKNRRPRQTVDYNCMSLEIWFHVLYIDYHQWVYSMVLMPSKIDLSTSFEKTRFSIHKPSHWVGGFRSVDGNVARWFPRLADHDLAEHDLARGRPGKPRNAIRDPEWHWVEGIETAVARLKLWVVPMEAAAKQRNSTPSLYKDLMLGDNTRSHSLKRGMNCEAKIIFGRTPRRKPSSLLDSWDGWRFSEDTSISHSPAEQPWLWDLKDPWRLKRLESAVAMLGRWKWIILMRGSSLRLEKTDLAQSQRYIDRGTDTRNRFSVAKGVCQQRRPKVFPCFSLSEVA